MNSSYSINKVLDTATVNIIGWIAVLIFAISLSIFIYRLQGSFNSDIGGLKSVRNV